MTLQLFSYPSRPYDEALVAKAQQFADAEIRPFAEQWEQDRVQPEDVLRTAVSHFGGLQVPTELGGLGGTATTISLVYEAIAHADLAFAFALAVHCNTTASVARLQNHGDNKLADRYLPKLLSGDMLIGFLLTEPGAGSDATSIVTKAEATQGGWHLNGTKAWIINGRSADLLLTFAQTQHDSKSKGIAGFLIKAEQAGIQRNEPFDLLGGYAMGVNSISFDNCFAPAETLVFAPPTGFKEAMWGIDLARFGVASMCNGVLRGGLETAVSYAQQRHTFGQPVIQHQAIQAQLSDVLTKLEASRMLTFRAAEIMERGERATVIAAHAKKYATRITFAGLSTAMQAMGANGLRREHGLARQLAAAKATHYTDGATEIQNVVIGRTFLKRLGD